MKRLINISIKISFVRISY